MPWNSSHGKCIGFLVIITPHQTHRMALFSFFILLTIGVGYIEKTIPLASAKKHLLTRPHPALYLPWPKSTAILLVFLLVYSTQSFNPKLRPSKSMSGLKSMPFQFRSQYVKITLCLIIHNWNKHLLIFSSALKNYCRKLDVIETKLKPFLFNIIFCCVKNSLFAKVCAS